MDREQQALEECDREPIHIPGTIQQNGALLSLDPETKRITHVSANIGAYLGGTVEHWLGASIDAIGDRDLVHSINNLIGLPTIAERREPVCRLDRDGREFEVHGFRSGDVFVLEIEPSAPPPWAEAETSARISELLQLVNKQTEMQNLLNAAVRWLQRISGYDRVMVYRFAEDWSGEVVAEENISDHDGFLGLRFPKWDIPTQARAIMQRLPLRMITDIDQEPVPVQAVSAELPPLDLSIAQLRGVSPVHMEYLRNMGVQATMTLSIVVKGKLWGIISFHNYAPKVPTPRVRAICLPFIEYFNIKLTLLEDQEVQSARETVREIHQSIREEHAEGSDLKEVITGDPYPLIKQFDAQGMVLRLGENWHEFGTCLPWKTIQPLVAEANEHERIVAYTTLDDHLPDDETTAHGIAGLMIIPLGNGDAAVVFRQGKDAQVKWAGAPKKDIVEENGVVRLSPRGSFSLYMDTVHGTCAPWRPLDYELGEGLARIVLQTAQQRARIERTFFEDRDRQQKLMISELNHRVRNILALIRSVSRQARRSNSSLSSYSAALEQRIKALAVAHDLSNTGVVESVSLRKIIETEIQPYDDGGKRMILVGEDVSIRPDLCPIFALAIHELTTNAVKYGALSQPQGEISISLSREKGGCVVRWRERGGPKVQEPAQRGFGSTLIQQAIPFELDGRVDLRFEPDGVAAEIWLPDSVLGHGEAGVTYKSPIEPIDLAPAVEKRADPGRLLLVEDNFVIAMDMESILFDVGFQNVSTAASVQKAMNLIDRHSFAAAVLDMHLGDENSFPIARELRTRGVPVLFVTGYGSDLERPEDIAEIPFLTKPVEQSVLAETLFGLIHQAETTRSGK
jgi:light-regulated signal transduction histidine kinase (bacteriophytochrome)/CheY-like chemotaxis protein